MPEMLVNKTISVCPICKKEIDADIVERYGSVFMEKTCGEHGRFEVKIAKHAWYYKGLSSFYDAVFPQDFYRNRQCLFYVLFVTSQCNLNCPICFTDANTTRHIQDIPIETIKRYLDTIRNRRRIIRLSGGEPTSRDDLPEIIRLIAKSGNFPYMFTNGLKIADCAYLEILKNNGLKGIIMWLDSLKNDGIHKLTRGREVLKEKMQAIENIKKSNIPFCLYHIKAKGLNDSDTEDCWDYILKNKFIKTFWIKSYAHLGKKGFSKANEFIIDELIEDVAKISKGMFTLEDMYWYQKFNYILAALENTPFCYYSQTILLPRNNSYPIKFIRYSKLIDKFEKKWKESPQEARQYFRYKIAQELLKHSSVSMKYFLLMFKLSKQPLYKVIHDFLPSDFFFLIINTFYDSWNYDKLMISRQCHNGVFHLDPLKNFPLCDLTAKIFS